MNEIEQIKEAMRLYSKLEYAGDVREEMAWIKTSDYLLKGIKKFEVLERYAKHLATMYPQYRRQQYNGKNGADSENEKGYWRGMADSVLAFLTDLKNHGLIAHSGLYEDKWPEEQK